jgi:hypothetical protein
MHASHACSDAGERGDLTACREPRDTTRMTLMHVMQRMHAAAH